MFNIKLGVEQKEALNRIIRFIALGNTCFSLYGSAGTGKTTITRNVISHLEQNRIPYVLCAPTHQAKIVLEDATGREGITLHKLLSLSPNIEIMNLDFNNLFFIEKKQKTFFPKNGLIIVDESSMINDYLFDLLVQKAKQHNCKILFQGDIAQLQPVNSRVHSKVFEVEDRIELTKIYRQSSESGLITVLPILRKEIIPIFKEAIGSEGSLYTYDNAKDFFIEAIPLFKKALKESSPSKVKMLAYTNARVIAFNNKMRKVLFKENNEYNKFEFLKGNENFEFNKCQFWNSLDYVIVDEPRKAEVLIPHFIKLPGYFLNLYNASTRITEEVFILSKEIPKDYMDSLIYQIEALRLQAIDAMKFNRRAAGMIWKKYYEIMGSFATPVNLYYSNRLIRKQSFAYGYSHTVHKSQGSSIDNTFVDIGNINSCRNLDELRQLQYVAVSRTRKNAYILQ